MPSTNQPLSLSSHPYATVNFDNEYHGWHDVARGSTQMADALVYNIDGAGHMFIYEKGDPWGSVYAYECRNCSEGCVYNLRPVSSSYKTISRDGMTAGSSSGGDGNVYAVMRAATGTGTTEVHVLNRATNYQTFLSEAGTFLHETGTDGSWMFRMADYNNDGRQDLWAIAKNAVQTDVHVLDGATNFQTFLFKTFLLHTVSGSAAIGTDNSRMLDLADYNNDGKPDLWVIVKSATGSGTTEVHILSGADNFVTYIAHLATGLHLTGTDGRWYFSVADYNGDGRPDLYAIDKQDGSGKTAVHVLNAADGFKTFLLHSVSALGPTGTDHRWVFDL